MVLKRIKELKSIFECHMNRNSVSVYANAVKVKPSDFQTHCTARIYTYNKGQNFNLLSDVILFEQPEETQFILLSLSTNLLS